MWERQDYFSMATWPVEKHQCQIVGESFLLADGDYAILFFLCLVHDLNGLPKGYMSLIFTSKDTIQKA